MIGRQELRHHFDGAPDALAILARVVHGEDLHAFLDMVLAGGKELALGGPFSPLLAVDLHDAKAADRDRSHMLQMTERGDGNLGLAAHFLVKRAGRIVNGGVAGSRPLLQVEHEIAVGIGERFGQRDPDRLAVDLQGDDFLVIGFARIVLAKEMSRAVAAKQAFIVVADEKTFG